MFNYKSKEFSIFLVIFILFPYLSTVESKSSMVAIVEGDEYKYWVDEFEISVNRSNRDNILRTNFNVAGSDPQIPGRGNNNFSIILNSITADNIKYNVKLKDSSQEQSILLENIINVIDLRNRDMFEFFNISDVASIFPFIIPVTGENDSLWTTLKDNIFTSSSQSGNGNMVDSQIENGVFYTDIHESDIRISDSFIESKTFQLQFDVDTGLLHYLRIVASLAEIDSSTGIETSGVAKITIIRDFPTPDIPGFELITFIIGIPFMVTVTYRVRGNE